MEALTTQNITIFLVVVGIALILARLLFRMGRYVPPLVAELLAGIILGPTVLGYIFPDMHQIFFPEEGALRSAYDTLFTLSIIMLLFLAGMEVDFQLLSKSKKTIFITSLLGILLPLGVGIWAGWQFLSFFHGFEFSAAPFVFPLVFGTIIALSALPVIIRVLMELNIMNTSLGTTIIGTALVTDVVGWLLFSSILIYANPTIENIHILYTVFYIILFFAVMIILSSSRKFMVKLFAQPIIAKGDVAYDMSMLFGVCLLSGAFTNAINVHPSLGAFISGIVCRRIIGENLHIFELLKVFVMNFFAPIFFISIGLQLNFFQELNIPMLLAVFVLACAVKLFGATLGAYFSGYSLRPAFVIGFSLNARGAMEIIMGAVALKIGLIGNQLFVCFVLVAIITSLLAQPIVTKIMKDMSGQAPPPEGEGAS